MMTMAHANALSPPRANYAVVPWEGTRERERERASGRAGIAAFVAKK